MGAVRPLAVGIPCLCATVAGDDDVAVLQARAGVPARYQVGVAGVAGETHEFAGEAQAVALGDAAREADVLARALVIAVARGGFRERGESLDALLRDGHTPRFGDGDRKPFR